MVNVCGQTYSESLSEINKKLKSKFLFVELLDTKYFHDGYHFRCLLCGKTFSSKGYNIYQRRMCRLCSYKTLRSFGESYLIELFLENDINFEYQKTFNLRNKKTGHLLYFDFYLSNYNMVIEYNGIQHYKKDCSWYNEDYHKRDLYKRNFLKKHDIKILEIPYDLTTEEINNLISKEIGIKIKNVDNENLKKHFFKSYDTKYSRFLKLIKKYGFLKARKKTDFIINSSESWYEALMKIILDEATDRLKNETFMKVLEEYNLSSDCLNKNKLSKNFKNKYNMEKKQYDIYNKNYNSPYYVDYLLKGEKRNE